MRALFIILANGFFTFSVFAEVAKNSVEPHSQNIAGRAASPLEFAFILFLLFVVFKIFGVKNKPKKVKNFKPDLKLPTFADIVTDAVGELKAVGPNTKVGSKLIENKDDIDTYLFVAKVDKGNVRKEEQAKAIEIKKSMNNIIKWITIIALFSIMLNIFLFIF